ncbi:hypothetical protein BMS3Abin14_01765 [bacterium BMS3Abin14]|nr:hypothetical protein BMS3Abin14_01765 [bacterium BMS3Abin14]
MAAYHHILPLPQGERTEVRGETCTLPQPLPSREGGCYCRP